VNDVAAEVEQALDPPLGLDDSPSKESRDGWPALLRRIAARGPGAPLPASSDPAADFIRRWTIHARAEAATRFPLLGCVGEAASAALLNDLAEELTDDADPVLRLEASAFRTALQGPFAGWFASDDSAVSGPSDPDAELFRWVREEGWATILRRHPFLARALTIRTQHWLDATAEFLERLSDDLPLLQARFAPDGGAFRILELDGRRSDRHRGGRSVVEMRLSSGGAVFYKPRPVAAEVAFGVLIDWLRARGFEYEGRLPTVIDRGSYGWMEGVTRSPCTSTQEFALYYRQAGLLLALFHGLGSTDVHFDNLIAAGPHPVPVDLETLVGPVLGSGGARSPATAPEIAAQALASSVLRTSLLPMWHPPPGPGSVSQDIGGFGTGSGVTGARRHLPRTDGGEVADPVQWMPALLEGFDAGYRVLEEHRGALSDPSGPLGQLHDAPVRVVLRDTRIYERLRKAGLEPGFTHATAERRQLYRPLFPDPDHDPSSGEWRLAQAEMESLERGDIPSFAVTGDSTAVMDDVGRIFGAGGTGAWTTLRARLAALGEEDRIRQRCIVEATYAMAGGALEPSTERDSTAQTADRRLERSDARPARAGGRRRREVDASDELLRAAERIGERLMAGAIRHAGGATWLTPTYHPPTGRYRLDVAPPGLYRGSCGAALFLAALGRATGRPEFTALSRETMASLGPTDPVRAVPSGSAGTSLAEGLAGLAYAWTRIAALLGDDSLRSDAAEWLAAVPRKPEDEPVPSDLLNGSAGVLLAHLALYRETGADLHLQRAVERGEDLLRNRERTPSGPRAWPSMGSFLTGFAHGASGIGRALAGLATATGDERFAAAAREGFEFERVHRSPSEGRWADLRPAAARDGGGHTAAHTTFGWCTGAPGITLGRLASLAVLDEASREDLAVGLASTRRLLLSAPADHLCCGRTGAVEVLAYAAEVLPDRADLHAEAVDGALRIVREAEERGDYRFRAASSASLPPIGLLQGIAGVGYGLLRLARPGGYVSICALD